jgi:Tfp pilus assembly PilM family ATPase
MTITIESRLHEVQGYPQLRSVSVHDVPAGALAQANYCAVQLIASAMVQAMHTAAQTQGHVALSVEVAPLRRLLERLLTLVARIDARNLPVDVHAAIREGIAAYGDPDLVGEYGVEFWFSQMLRLLLQKQPDTLV